MRYNPDIYTGLSDKQVKLRKEQGLINYDTSIKTLSIPSIISKNVFTLFNLLNLVIASFIFFVGSYKNLLFLGIVFCNTIISIIQEIRSKKIIDKLNVVAEKKVLVIRDGKEFLILTDSLVLDDIVKYKIGNQIIADSIIKKGVVEVDESFITGEANHVLKKKGDMLYSGSFIVSGRCICKVEHVGLDNYTAKISRDAKYIKKVNSVIVNTLNKIIKIISFVIVPLGIILFLRQLSASNVEQAVVSTAAALISMIPEGLVLLTSTVFLVSAVRLSKRKVLVQDLYCTESLARVDTICLDKTGTLTVGDIELIKTISLNKNYDLNKILSSIANTLAGDNKTMDAIHSVYNKSVNLKPIKKVPFSSSRKYSGVSFEGNGSFVIGAKEMLCPNIENEVFIKYKDYRLLVIMHSREYFDSYELPNNLELIGVLIFQDKLRSNAKETLDYFKKEGVDVKIITGDSFNSTSAILKRLNIKMNVVDLSKIKDSKNLDRIACDYNVFCRVLPEEKKGLVQALKNNGHTVAFVGDGVNDVLALKEADSSIAIADGSEAARNVSQLVLLDSNFKSIPSIVREGRRTINNIERSSCLFLTKTTYSTLLAIVFLFISMSYPFQPIQLSLTSVVTIGIPSFILALEPNKKKVQGNFFLNVIKRSIPSAITIVVDVLMIIFFSHLFKFNDLETSTMAVMLVAFTGFLLLFKLCYPFNKLRLSLYIFLVVIFVICVLGLHNLFDLVLLKPFMFLFLGSLCLLDISMFSELSYLFDRKLFKYKEKIIKITNQN